MVRSRSRSETVVQQSGDIVNWPIVRIRDSLLKITRSTNHQLEAENGKLERQGSTQCTIPLSGQFSLRALSKVLNWPSVPFCLRDTLKRHQSDDGPSDGQQQHDYEIMMIHGRYSRTTTGSNADAILAKRMRSASYARIYGGKKRSRHGSPCQD
jgi:hypothetical protein